MTIAHTLRRSVLILLALLAMASAARAQEIAGSFDQLRVLVKPGDTITITDQAGVATKGRLTELSAASLALMVDGQPRTVAASDIQVIRQRRSDGLANGAAWGFGIGAALGVAAGVVLESEYDEDSHGALVFWGALIYGGMGAGIGAGFDALYQSPQVIYARPRTTAQRFSVAPMVGRATGVRIAVGF